MAQRDIYLSKFINAHLENGRSDAAEFYHDDPTVVGFNVFFYFNDIPTNLPGTTLSPLFNEDPSRESAYRYLLAVDEPRRAEKLLRFKERLRRLTQETPYYYQTLSGLENLYEFNHEVPFRMNEKMLTIQTLESIDLRVGTMISRYMEAVYDYQYHRMMLPKNLVEFTCIIMVSEIRNFRQVAQAAVQDVENKFELANDKIGVHSYIFEKCTFDFTESNPFLNEISNAEGEMSENQFSIKLGQLKEAHKLNFIDLFSQGGERSDEIFNKEDRDLSSLTPLENMAKPISTTAGGRAVELANFMRNFFDRERDFFTDKFDLETLSNRAANQLFDIVDSRIRSLALGNIFSDFSRFRNGDLLSDIQGVIANLANNNDDFNRSINSPILNTPISGSPVRNALDAIDLRQRDINFNEIFLGNVESFISSPFSAVLNQIIAGSLGNIFNRG